MNVHSPTNLNDSEWQPNVKPRSKISIENGAAVDPRQSHGDVHHADAYGNVCMRQGGSQSRLATTLQAKTMIVELEPKTTAAADTLVAALYPSHVQQLAACCVLLCVLLLLVCRCC